MVRSVGDLLSELRREAATILIAEQNMHFCLGVTPDTMVIDKGAMVYRDAVAWLRANAEVCSRYLAL